MGKRRPKKRQSTRHTPSTNTRSGRIIGRKGPVYFVMADNREQTTCVARGAAKRAVIGDRVAFEPQVETDMAEGLLIAIDERTSELFRTDALGRRPQTIAANVDQIFVVAAAVPEMREGLIDRYLVAAHAHDINTHLIFNKIDLLDPQTQVHIRDRLQVYRDIGISVLETSILSPESLAGLAQCLHNKTSIFVGHSGVGKTSLINTLCPDVSERVQAISEATGKGQHTTTTSWAYPLPDGGEIIDSPGIRSFGLWGIQPEDLRDHFVEFLEHAHMCRFGNCQHISEPRCAVQVALAEGEINQIRYDSYVRMRQSLSDELN